MTGRELVELLQKHDLDQQIEILHKSKEKTIIYWINSVEFTEGCGYFIMTDRIETVLENFKC